nr:MAG TPA: hypothetical protein [Caudoviricetes sp.]
MALSLISMAFSILSMIVRLPPVKLSLETYGSVGSSTLLSVSFNIPVCRLYRVGRHGDIANLEKRILCMMMMIRCLSVSCAQGILPATSISRLA